MRSSSFELAVCCLVSMFLNLKPSTLPLTVAVNEVCPQNVSQLRVLRFGKLFGLRSGRDLGMMSTLSYKNSNLLFCRVSMNSILGFIIRA